MPFSRSGRYQSEAAADREEDANASAEPLWEDDAADAIRTAYQGRLLRSDDRHAFAACCAEYGYEPSIKALGEVSAAAGRIQRLRGRR